MTPWKLRDRLRSLFGAKPVPPEDEPLPKYAVTYMLPNGEPQQAMTMKGSTLVLASGNLQWPIDTGCADSTCATCQVDVISGGDQLTKPTDSEARTLQRNGAPAERRLGCRAKVMGPGITVGMVNVLGWKQPGPTS
jgi:ferredoxin